MALRDEGEARAQLQQELRDVFDGSALDLAFERFVTKAQKVEAIRVLQGLKGEVGLGSWESCCAKLVMAFPERSTVRRSMW